MKIAPHHSWNLTAEEAIALQQELRPQVIAENRCDRIEFVAGIDVGYEANNTVSRSAIAVLSFPDLQLQETAIARRPTPFPYIPGLLSFREVPVVLDALEKLTIAPDLLLCDGQGYAHPRRFGLACHLGVLVDLPAIGVAKSRYIGQHAELPTPRGSWQPLTDNGETIGAVLRTQTGVKPIYVSVGHRISLPTAIDFTLRCTPQYRLPETTRQADRLSRC
ncbi:MAG TPA: deoxyribonuclease V [Oscillatoriales cyanobacterium M59_W2019_021]|nr:MAG: deoxyribonuclease V [Cyanobacteria bacterium J055]HIK32982.1 deoxyribonuclease V [Oscillatoriales cyanobacterium M4454_W2019_049]HIK53518.1 deoxyribonuclease V [Oscillatoriales cyanobacterium M59_W2019_021]